MLLPPRLPRHQNALSGADTDKGALSAEVERLTTRVAELEGEVDDSYVDGNLMLEKKGIEVGSSLPLISFIFRTPLTSGFFLIPSNGCRSEAEIQRYEQMKVAREKEVGSLGFLLSPFLFCWEGGGATPTFVFRCLQSSVADPHPPLFALFSFSLPTLH